MDKRTLEVIAEGDGAYLPVDPDDFRDAVGRKTRKLVSKVMTAEEAIARFVADGDYVVWDCNYLQRGPSALIREIMRQRKTKLWAGGKFTWVAVALLVEAGCCDRADMGFFMGGPGMNRAILEGRFTVYEYSNVVLTVRLRAGAMGVTFLPVRSLGGTDNFRYSGAKLIEDPYTGQPTVIVPALNPDVAIIHVHQADVHGNARIFGAGITDVESALASKKVILSAEEIIETEDIRHNPGLTKIPYYAVDAVVHQPFGSYPGECPGCYASDTEHVAEVFTAMHSDGLGEYLQKWVYDFSSEEEMLGKRVGLARLRDLQRRATVREGFRP
ncbi:MAG: glutaconate CoA-transferase, subunit [Candidatus Binatota bacterium]|nr:glutaconate CoA-transferase, subunit [Candidatus Binatota bacterium]